MSRISWNKIPKFIDINLPITYNSLYSTYKINWGEKLI